MRSNLTIKKGDSGSAGLLEEKCVIIEAPNLVTKIDTNRCQQQKSDKNHQKSQNQKINKIKKSEKIQKVIKSENQKSEKSQKCKSEKVKK